MFKSRNKGGNEETRKDRILEEPIQKRHRDEQVSTTRGETWREKEMI